MTDPSFTPDVRSEPLRPQRSQMTGTLVSLLAWIVVIVPMCGMALIIFAAVTNPSTSLATISKLVLIVLGVLLMFCMVITPHMMGQAVIYRERALWKAALWTGIPTVGVILYLVFRWLLNS